MSADAAAPRRLAAVLAVEPLAAADQAGGASARAAVLRDTAAYVRGAVEHAGGRILDDAGDALLAEFAGATGAVNCARGALQRAAERGSRAGAAGRVDLRAAVHAGEFPVELGRVAGEEAGLARRLLPLADPGGLALSEPVWREVRGQIPLRGRLVRPGGAGLPAGLRVFLVAPANAAWLPWVIRHGGWRTPAAALAVAALALAAATRAPWSRLRGPAEVVRVLHAFEVPEGIYPYSGGGGSITWSLVEGGPHGRAARVAYGQPAGSAFWALGVNVHQDLSAYQAIRVWLKSETGHPVRLQLAEESGELWVATVTPPREFAPVTIPFARFTQRADFNGGQVNNRLDLGMIRAVELIQDAGPASDTLWVDELAAVGPVPGAGR